MKKVLILGRSGQLARALTEATVVHGMASFFAGRETVQLDDPQCVARLIRDIGPDAVINAAAYTAVDKAEDDIEAAMALNAHLPAMLADVCATQGACLVHVSTDYVFDGGKSGEYEEDDPVAPLNVYGRSKAAGEAAVLQSAARACVVRTSWVHSASGANFVRTMLRLAQTNSVVRVVADQFGRPTSAKTLAADCMALARLLHDGDLRAGGLVHASDGGEPCSWAQLAEFVFACARDHGRPAAEVDPIPASAYPTTARRPQNSVLCLRKIEALLGERRHWKAGVRGVCAEIFAQSPV